MTITRKSLVENMSGCLVLVLIVTLTNAQQESLVRLTSSLQRQMQEQFAERQGQPQNPQSLQQQQRGFRVLRQSPQQLTQKARISSTQLPQPELRQGQQQRVVWPSSLSALALQATQNGASGIRQRELQLSALPPGGQGQRQLGNGQLVSSPRGQMSESLRSQPGQTTLAAQRIPSVKSTGATQESRTMRVMTLAHYQQLVRQRQLQQQRLQQSPKQQQQQKQRPQQQAGATPATGDQISLLLQQQMAEQTAEIKRQRQELQDIQQFLAQQRQLLANNSWLQPSADILRTQTSNSSTQPAVNIAQDGNYSQTGISPTQNVDQISTNPLANDAGSIHSISESTQVLSPSKVMRLVAQDQVTLGIVAQGQVSQGQVSQGQVAQDRVVQGQVAHGKVDKAGQNMVSSATSSALDPGLADNTVSGTGSNAAVQKTTSSTQVVLDPALGPALSPALEPALEPTLGSAKAVGVEQPSVSTNTPIFTASSPGSASLADLLVNAARALLGPSADPVAVQAAAAALGAALNSTATAGIQTASPAPPAPPNSEVPSTTPTQVSRVPAKTSTASPKMMMSRLTTPTISQSSVVWSSSMTHKASTTPVNEQAQGVHQLATAANSLSSAPPLTIPQLDTTQVPTLPPAAPSTKPQVSTLLPAALSTRPQTTNLPAMLNINMSTSTLTYNIDVHVATNQLTSDQTFPIVAKVKKPNESILLFNESPVTILKPDATPTTLPPNSAVITTPLPLVRTEYTWELNAASETTLLPNVVPETTLLPTKEPKTTQLPNFIPETTQLPNVVPETTQLPNVVLETTRNHTNT